MTLYWILCFAYIVVFFLFYISKGSIRSKKIISFFLLLGLVLLTTFRPLEIPDTEGYVYIFNRIDSLSNISIGFKDLLGREYISGTEYGFVYLIKILIAVGSKNYRFIFFVISVIEIYFFSIFAKNIYRDDFSKRIGLCYYFLPYFGLMYLLVPIRAGICLSMCLAAFSLTKNIKSKKFIRICESIFIYLLAFTIHRMSVLFAVIELVFYVMPLFKRKTYWILWTLSGIMIFLMRISLFTTIQNWLKIIASRVGLFESYSGYFSKKIVVEGLSFRSLFFLLLGALILYVCSDKQLENNKRYFNFYIVGLFIMSGFAFISGSFRINDFFFSLLPIMMTNLNISDCRKKISNVLLFSIEFIYGVLGVVIVMRL